MRPLRGLRQQAPPGFEPGMADLQSAALNHLAKGPNQVNSSYSSASYHVGLRGSYGGWWTSRRPSVAQASPSQDQASGGRVSRCSGPLAAPPLPTRTRLNSHMRISSPSLRRVGPEIRVPFRKVPFFEATSCSSQLL